GAVTAVGLGVVGGAFSAISPEVGLAINLAEAGAGAYSVAAGFQNGQYAVAGAGIVLLAFSLYAASENFTEGTNPQSIASESNSGNGQGYSQGGTRITSTTGGTASEQQEVEEELETIFDTPRGKAMASTLLQNHRQINIQLNHSGQLNSPSAPGNVVNI